MSRRVSHWERKLGDFIAEYKNKPQDWGQVDCALTTCNWILISTGIDCAEEFRGRYKTKLGARRVLNNFAGGLEGTVEKKFLQHEFEEINPVFRQRGDAILARGNGDKCLCFVGLRGIIWCSGKDGLDQVLENNVLRAWRIS